MKITFFDPDDDNKKPKRKLSKPVRKGKKGHFTLDWVSELGWKRNPFEMEDVPIAGFEDERQELNLFFIKKKHFGVLIGGDGSGKTSLLKWLMKELRNYKGIDPHFIDAEQATSDARMRTMIADQFRGIFKRGDKITKEDLVELISSKVNGRFVLAIDNSHLLNAAQIADLEAILHLDCSIICASAKKMSRLPDKDELHLFLKKRSNEDVIRILSERIALVGGSGVHPFTKDVIIRMAKQTNSTREFLALAHETAINISLKKVVLEEETSEEEIAEEQEDKVARKRGKKHNQEKPGKKSKRKYDELIESLSSDMED